VKISYFISHEPKAETEGKQKKDYAGMGALIFTFTVMSIVIGLSIYTAWQLLMEPKYLRI
jgi:hypothetical protein